MQLLTRVWTLVFVSLFMVACGGSSGGGSNPIGGGGGGGGGGGDTTAPQVTSTSPADGATDISGQNLMITATFDEALDASTVDATTFVVTDASSAGVGGTVSASGDTATFEVTGNLMSMATYTVTLGTGITDAAGNGLTADVVFTFTIGDETAPTLASFNPADGAGDVAADAVVTITFDEAMSVASIDNTTFTLVDDASNTIAGMVTLDTTNTIATFTPTADLPLATTFTAEATSSITDEAGNAFAGFSWQFSVPGQLSISSRSPAADATDVAVDTTVSATFSMALNAATVDDTTFTLVNSNTGASVAGTVALDAASNTVTLTPDSDLGLLSQYSATATTGINDTVGGSLTADDAWQFTTVDGAWTDSSLLVSLMDADTTDLRVAIDGDGNAIAVWHESGELFAGRFDAGTSSWGLPQMLETGVEGVDAPQIAMNESGDALVVWDQDDGVEDSIWAANFDPASGWSMAVQIDSEDTTAFDPQVAIDSAGNGIAVWEQDNGGTGDEDIWANRFDATTGWGTPEIIESELEDAQDPKVAIDGTGNAIAVWEQEDAGEIERAYSNRFDAATSSWGSSEAIEVVAGDDDAEDIGVAVNAAGDAIALWLEADEDIWHNRFDAATGTWGTAALVFDSAAETQETRIAIDNAGNGIALWQEDNAGNDSVLISSFDASTGVWGTPVEVDATTADIDQAEVAIDPNSGSAIAVWREDGTGFNEVFAARYNGATATWAVPELIQNDGVGRDSTSPEVAVNGNGIGILVSREESAAGNDEIYSNRFE